MLVFILCFLTLSLPRTKLHATITNWKVLINISPSAIMMRSSSTYPNDMCKSYSETIQETRAFCAKSMQTRKNSQINMKCTYFVKSTFSIRPQRMRDAIASLKVLTAILIKDNRRQINCSTAATFWPTPGGTPRARRELEEVRVRWAMDTLQINPGWAHKVAKGGHRALFRPRRLNLAQNRMFIIYLSSLHTFTWKSAAEQIQKNLAHIHDNSVRTWCTHTSVCRNCQTSDGLYENACCGMHEDAICV